MCVSHTNLISQQYLQAFPCHICIQKLPYFKGDPTTIAFLQKLQGINEEMQKKLYPGHDRTIPDNSPLSSTLRQDELWKLG